jgi:AcrR family transcriptional regulator
MAEPVKKTRGYESPRRREQAAATRSVILEAARRLFEERGYPATTMAAIGKEAKVSLKTVYVVFETKSGVLRALWHLSLRGDAGDATVSDRDWYRAVLDERDPVRQLQLNAHNSGVVKQRAGAIFGVIRDAAASEPEIAELWARIETEFYENQRAIVATLAGRGALRPELDVTRGADILWALNHPDTWCNLVQVRGWSPEEYERWFGESAASQLLARNAT